jgi:hypothetical protein
VGRLSGIITVPAIWVISASFVRAQAADLTDAARSPR